MMSNATDIGKHFNGTYRADMQDHSCPEQSDAFKVVLADEQKIVRHGLKLLLQAQPDIHVVGETGDGVEALRLCETLFPDIVILDLMLKGLNGIELARQMSKRLPKTRTIIYSSQANEHYVLDAVRAGAMAYVLKECDLSELLKAVRQVISGHRFLCSPLTDLVIDTYAQNSKIVHKDPYDTLTAREREVLQLAAQDYNTNTEIAARLFISKRTVEIHRTNIIRKLGLRAPHVSLVRYAVERGIVKPMCVPMSQEELGGAGDRSA